MTAPRFDLATATVGQLEAYLAGHSDGQAFAMSAMAGWWWRQGYDAGRRDEERELAELHRQAMRTVHAAASWPDPSRAARLRRMEAASERIRAELAEAKAARLASERAGGAAA